MKPPGWRPFHHAEVYRRAQKGELCWPSGRRAGRNRTTMAEVPVRVVAYYPRRRAVREAAVRDQEQ